MTESYTKKFYSRRNRSNLHMLDSIRLKAFLSLVHLSQSEFYGIASPIVKRNLRKSSCLLILLDVLPFTLVGPRFQRNNVGKN